MAGGLCLFLFLCSILFCLVASQGYHDGSEYSLSELTVLLPYTSARARVKYQLHARATAHSLGCFKFKAMNTDIVVVDPVYKEEDHKGCARSAFIAVSPTLTSLSRVSTFVVAEDTSSGRVLRCEVFVAPIAALTVHTTTKSVYRDEHEMLQIFATDPEGNTFSTLRGVEFEWHVSNDQETESNRNNLNGRDILKIVPFKGSQQEVDPLIMMMELQGLQTDVILVQGISIGRALVSVQLMDSQYTTEVRRASVGILVFESFMITPAQTLYVTTGTQVFYHLWNVHQQQMTRVLMPNPLFIWATSNNTVATVNDKGDVLALQLGYSAVIVCAGNFRENEARGAIQVVEPGKLTVSIEQKGHPPVFAEEYYLIVGTEYIMKVYLFDKHEHSIYYNGTVIFEVSIPSQEHYIDIQIQSQSRNTSHFITKSVGHTQFTISMNSLKNAISGYSIPMSPVLSKTLSVFITEPITLGCSKVYLPWVSGVGGLPHYQLKAAGGSNETSWFTTEKDIVAVDSRGYLTGISVGSTNIVAEDRNNPLNRAKTNVVVGHVPPISLRASSNEVIVGGSITLRAGMWDWSGLTQEGGPYDCFSCESASIVWEEKGDAFFVDSASASNVASEGGAIRGQCAVNVFVASHAGSSIIHVSYGDSHVEVTIFAYEPLRVVEPQFSLVTLGSSTEYELAGGPAPWYQDNSLHYLTTSHEGVQAAQTSRNTLRIACRSHGDFNITITSGNRATESNPRPVTSSVVVSFRCHPVHLVRLVPPDVTKLDSRCVSKEDTLDMYRFPNYYSIPFGYELRDKQDKLFTNSSSVQLDWISENKTVATFARPAANKMSKDTKVALNTEKNNGTTLVRVLVTGYKSDHLREANVLSSDIHTIKQGDIEHKIKLILFDKLSLSSFPQSPLYVDPRVFATINVHGGSGVFSFNIQNTSVAKLAYEGDNRDSSTVKVFPIAQGNAEVVVGDLCTPEYNQVTELLHFSGTHNLLVHGTDKVAVNSTVKFTVQPTDVYGTVFHPSQYTYMDFGAKTELPHVYIEKASNSGEFLFRSDYAGLVEVVFSVTTTQASPPIRASKTRQVTVFPPFRVIPSAVTLLVGETHDVSWKGGPYEGNIFGDKLRMIFESANPKIAVMEQARTIRAISLGSTTIRITPTLVDQESEFNVFDEVHVTVRQISGIAVRSGSTTILESNSLKLHVEGHDGESPLGFGLRSVFFTWESDNPRVLSVEHLAKTKESGMGVSVRIVALAPGRATITALAMPLLGPDSHAGYKDILSYPALKDTITIEVPPRLGTSCDQPLLIPPHGSVQLFDLYRPHQDIKYSLMHPSHGTGCNDIVRSVAKDGQLKAGGSLGHCHVHVAATSTNQALSRHVIVDKVALLVTGPHREGDNVLDVRQRVEYYVKPKNSLGSEFIDTERVQLDFEVQPVGIVKLRLDNLTLQVTAERSGKAVVRIFLVEDPKVQDYFELHVRDLAGQSIPVSSSVSASQQARAPLNQGYRVQVHTNKPISHHIPLEPVWHQVEFLENKVDVKPTDVGNIEGKYQCSIKEAQWATAKAHTTSAAHYCIITPSIPTSPADIVTNLTLVIDSEYLQVHHEQSIPQAPIFAVIGPTERTFTPALEPQSVTLFSSSPNAKVVSSSSLRVRPTLQRAVGSGYVTDYLIEFANKPASGTSNLDEDYYIHFYEDGTKGSDIRMKLSLEEGTNYLLAVLCAVLVILLTLILCGIPYRTFPRAHTPRANVEPTSPSSSPPHKISSPSPAQPATGTLQSPYPNSSYALSPQPLSSPHTPIAASPPRFMVNTNQSFYESQRLRGPKF